MSLNKQAAIAAFPFLEIQMSEIRIIKKLCGDNHIEAAQLIKELVKHMEEIYILSHREILHNPEAAGNDILREIKTLARDSLATAKDK